LHRDANAGKLDFLIAEAREDGKQGDLQTGQIRNEIPGDGKPIRIIHLCDTVAWKGVKTWRRCVSAIITVRWVWWNPAAPMPNTID